MGTPTLTGYKQKPRRHTSSSNPPSTWQRLRSKYDMVATSRKVSGMTASRADGQPTGRLQEAATQREHPICRSCPPCRARRLRAGQQLPYIEAKPSGAKTAREHWLSRQNSVQEHRSSRRSHTQRFMGW